MRDAHLRESLSAGERALNEASANAAYADEPTRMALLSALEDLGMATQILGVD